MKRTILALFAMLGLSACAHENQESMQPTGSPYNSASNPSQPSYTTPPPDQTAPPPSSGTSTGQPSGTPSGTMDNGGMTNPSGTPGSSSTPGSSGTMNGNIPPPQP